MAAGRQEKKISSFFSTASRNCKANLNHLYHYFVYVYVYVVVVVVIVVVVIVVVIVVVVFKFFLRSGWFSRLKSYVELYMNPVVPSRRCHGMHS
jgi:hypothetical protein